MATSEKLPNGWKWVSHIPFMDEINLYVLVGRYPIRDHFLCIVQKGGEFRVIRHDGVNAVPDLICDTLEEAKAVSLAMVRLDGKGKE